MGETSSSWHLTSRLRLNSWWKELPVDCKQTYLWTWVSSWHRCLSSRVSHGDQVTRVRGSSSQLYWGGSSVHLYEPLWTLAAPRPQFGWGGSLAGWTLWPQNQDQGPHWENQVAKSWLTQHVELLTMLSRTWSEPRVGGGHGWLTPPLCPARPPAALVNPQQPPCRAGITHFCELLPTGQVTPQDEDSSGLWSCTRVNVHCPGRGPRLGGTRDSGGCWLPSHLLLVFPSRAPHFQLPPPMGHISCRPLPQAARTSCRTCL